MASAMQQSDDSGDERAAMNNEQRLKAATYYSIKQISKEVEEDMGVSFSAQLLATLNESLHRQVNTWTVDLEHFAKHAKRTDINLADVRLLGRRNNTMVAHLDTLIDEMNVTDQENRQQKESKGTKRKGKKTKETNVEDQDDD